MKKYTIREGFSFVLPNGDVLVGGETVDLPDDVAEQHLHKLEADPDAEIMSGAGTDPDAEIMSGAGTDPE